MKIFPMLLSFVVMYLFHSAVKSAAFVYHTYNNIQGEVPSGYYGYKNHGSDASNTNNEDNDIQISPDNNYDARKFATNKNGHNNIPNAPENYIDKNNYDVPEEKARNNSKKNYILVTYYFKKDKNDIMNDSPPEDYAINTKGEVPDKNFANGNSILKEPSTFDKCNDYIYGRTRYLGEIWYNNTKCEQYVCKFGEQNIPYIQTNRCGVFVSQPNCQIRQNYGKIYPSCCPVLYCNGRYEGPVIHK